MTFKFDVKSITPIEESGGGGGSNVASDITVSTSGFQVITGKNVQSALGQIDKKLVLNEDYDSILLSLDVLNKDIGGGTELPLGSLQTQLIDGRPSHKAPGALIYDEFGTIGILDHIEAQNAFVTTITFAGSGGSKTAVLPLNPTTKLENDTIFKANTMASLTITLPTLTDDFICQVEFTSGTSATSFTAPASIKWKGDDTDSGALVPQASSRYVLMFFSDGVNMRGISQKVGA